MKNVNASALHEQAEMIDEVMRNIQDLEFYLREGGLKNIADGLVKDYKKLYMISLNIETIANRDY